MINISVLLALCLYISLIVLSSSEVIQLNTDSLIKQVYESKDIWIIAFYNIDINQNNEYENILDNLYNKLKPYNIKIGIYNCLTDKSSKKQCQSIYAQQAITYILFDEYPTANPYTRKLYRTPKPYQGVPENARTLEKFLINQFNPNNYKKVEQNELVSLDNDISNYSKPTVVILSGSKSSNIKNILYKLLAYKLSNKIDVVLYKALDNNYPTNKLKISDELSIHLIQPNKDPILYNGETADVDSIVDFINGIVDIGNDDVQTGNFKILSSIYTSNNFTDEVLQPDIEYVILVSNNLINDYPKWIQIESNAVGNIKSVIISCIDSFHSSNEFINKLCSNNENLPYTTIYPYSQTSRKKFLSSNKLTVYSSDESDKFISSIGKSLPDNLIVNLLESELDEFMKSSLDTQKLPTLLLVDDSKNIPLSIRNVILTLNKNINLGIIIKPSKNFIQNIGIYNVPSIVTMIPRIDTNDQTRVAFQPAVYDPNFHGPLKYDNIVKFLKSTVKDSIFGKEESTQDETIQSSDDSIVYEVTNNSTWFNSCPSSYRGLCVIYLTNTNDHYDENILLSITKTSNDNLARSGTVKLIHIDGQCKLGFTESFGLQTFSLPIIVSYFPFKNRFAIFKGSLSESSVRSFVNSLLTGVETTISLSNRPVVEDSCVLYEEISAEGESEDASDFLAEILAEEKAKQQELKKAIEEEKKRLDEQKKQENENKKSKNKKKKKSKSKKSN